MQFNEPPAAKTARQSPLLSLLPITPLVWLYSLFYAFSCMIFLFFFRRLVLYSTPAVRNLCDEISVGALIKWKAKSRAAKKKNFRVKAKAERKKSAHNSITKIDYDEINQGQSEEVEVARWRRYVTVKQAWVAFAPCFSPNKRRKRAWMSTWIHQLFIVVPPFFSRSSLVWVTLCDKES